MVCSLLLLHALLISSHYAVCLSVCRSGRQWAGVWSPCQWGCTDSSISMSGSPGPLRPRREPSRDSLWTTPVRSCSSSSATPDPTAATKSSSEHVNSHDQSVIIKTVIGNTLFSNPVCVCAYQGVGKCVCSALPAGRRHPSESGGRDHWHEQQDRAAGQPTEQG